MRLHGIQHVAIKTLDVDATNEFYTNILGMEFVDRPAFDFPGSWLSMGDTMIHVMGGRMAVDEDGRFTPGGAAVDHIALGAEGFDAYLKRFEEDKIEWWENDISSFGIWQLFVKDPNGVVIELNFNIADEADGSKGPPGERPYDGV